jgi:hypothetical protein
MALYGKISAILVLGSCVLAPQSTIVERSKEQRPAWVELSPAQSIVGDDLVQFHGTYDREPDLPLGIKRTQISSLEGSEAGVAVIVRAQVDSIAAAKNTPDAVLKSSEMDQAITEAVKRSHGTHAKVADIYYERHQSLAKTTSDPETATNGDFYLIHVLVQYPRTQIPAIYSDIGRSLQKSRNADVKRFGQILLSPSNQLSHQVSH